jgi:hypothetical protein
MGGGEGGGRKCRKILRIPFTTVYIHAWVAFYVLCVLCSHPLQNLRWSNNESTNKLLENKSTFNMFLFVTQSGHAFV